jgi:hypothetical protein
MGFIGKIIKHMITDSVREVVTEIYPEYNKRSIFIAPPGIDTLPILGDQSIETDDKFDQTVLVEINESGHTAVIGVIPPGIILEGEIKILGRNKLTGEQVSYILCKTDNNVEINGTGDFAVRYSILESAFNQLKSDFDLHTHPYVDTPIGASTTSPILVGSTADISLAKIETIIVPEVPN